MRLASQQVGEREVARRAMLLHCLVVLMWVDHGVAAWVALGAGPSEGQMYFTSAANASSGPWTLRDSAPRIFLSGNAYGAAFSRGAVSPVAVVVVGDGTNTLARTEDEGATWQVFGRTIFSNAGRAVAFGSDRFIAVGDGAGGSAMWSSDGRGWSFVSSSLATGYGVAYSPGRFW